MDVSKTTVSETPVSQRATDVMLCIMALFLSLTLLILGNSMLGTLLAVRMELESYNATVSGMVLACYSVGFVLGSIFCIRVVNRVGHIRAFATFGAVATAAVMIHSLHQSVPGWMILRLVVGYCVAGLMLVTESWVNARATATTRGALLAVYMIVFYLAASGGQFLLAAGDPAEFSLFVVAAVLLALSLVPLSLTRSPAPELQQGNRLSVVDLMRLSSLGLLAALLSGVVISAFSAVGPIYAVKSGLEIHQVSTFMGVTVLTAMLFQWPIGRISDFLPRRLVILGVTVGSMAAAGMAILFANSSLVLLFFGLASCLYALGLALTHDVLDHTQIVPASATLLLAFGLGTVVGPIGGAVAVQVIGPHGLFLFITAVLAILACLSVLALVQQSAPPVAEQTQCVGIAPVSTPQLMEIDPRNEDFQEFEPESLEPVQQEAQLGTQ